jgi:hypothetical protein
MEFYIMAIKKSSSSGIPSGLNASRPANPGYGQLYANGETARLELFTQASGWQNIVQETPGVASITGNYLESTNSGVITISGTNFVSGCYASAIGSNGVQVDATQTTFNSLVQVVATFTGLSNAYEPYDIKVTNPSNLFGLIPDALYVNANPAWTTAAGSLGTFAEQINATIYALSVSDDSTITYSLANGSSLPSGVTLSSAGVISGTLPDISSNTTYTFTVNATDGLNPTISRTFSFISNAAPVWNTTAGSLGSYLNNTSISLSALSATDTDTVTYTLASGSSLPSGITLNSSTGVISGTLPTVSSDTIYNFTINANDGVNVVPRSFSITSVIPVSTEYLVVAGGGGGGLGNGSYREGGGGGGAGGFKTGTLTLTPGTSYTITVGAKGSGRTGSTGFGTNGGDSIFSTITSTGGGAGAPHDTSGAAGGSGGGAGCQGSSGGNASPAGQGNAGGAGYQGSAAGAGGGGGAGGAGASGTSAGGGAGGAGGAGLSSSITGSAVLYAAGGGGGAHVTSGAAGGVGAGRGGGQQTSVTATAASDNTGSGGGGGPDTTNVGRDGGSGVVILKYPSTKTPIVTGSLIATTSTAVAGYKITSFNSGTGTVTF